MSSHAPDRTPMRAWALAAIVGAVVSGTIVALAPSSPRAVASTSAPAASPSPPTITLPADRVAGRAARISGQVLVSTTLRSYDLYIPASLGDPTIPAPLIIGLSAYTQSPADFESEARLDELAEQYGAYLLLPSPVDRRWGAGACCNPHPSQTNQVDDVAFIDTLIAELAKAYAIDSTRIDVVGLSNGAMMAQRYACERASTVAAVVSVAGTLEIGCTASRPVSLLQISAGRDSTVPYLGLSWSTVLLAPLLPVPTAVGFWEHADQCSGLPRLSATAVASLRTSDECAAATTVQLVYLPSSGHGWPTQAKDGYDATDAVLDFLRASPQNPTGAFRSTPDLSLQATTGSGQVHGMLLGRLDLVAGTPLSLRARKAGLWSSLPPVITDVAGGYTATLPTGYDLFELSTAIPGTTAAVVSFTRR